MPSAYKTREEWLHAAFRLMRRRFDSIGCPVPTDFHVSIGFRPGGGPESAYVMGCCYVRRASTGNVNEIFLSPEWDNPIDVLETFAHELIHAASDCADGHGPGFKVHALAFGFLSPMTQTPASDQLKRWLGAVAATLGPFPHTKTRILALRKAAAEVPIAEVPAATPAGGGKVHSGRPKQTTAMLKLECINPTCGFIARATAKNLDLGMPICACGTPLSSPQYAEVMYERFFNCPGWQWNPINGLTGEGERLDKRREWSRGRGFLPVLGAAVATVAKVVAKRAPKRVIPAPVVKALDSVREAVDWVEPYPKRLGDEEQYPEDALDMWDTAETIAERFRELDKALGDLIPA